MNEFGIDSLSLAAYMPLTQSMVDQISYMIQKSGTSSSGAAQIGTSAYFNQTMSTNAYFEQNVQLMQQNNKPIGAYFFSYAWDYNSAYYEAELECNHLDALTYKPDWPIFIDWETISRDAVAAHGYTITSGRIQDIIRGWVDGCRAHNYIPGFYTGASIARDELGASAVQNFRSQGIYFWEAHYTTAPQPWVVPYDIWQYKDNVSWNGTVVDYNTIGDDRMWNIGPTPGGGPLPIWLKLALAKRGETNGKYTVLL